MFWWQMGCLSGRCDASVANEMPRLHSRCHSSAPPAALFLILLPTPCQYAHCAPGLMHHVVSCGCRKASAFFCVTGKQKKTRVYFEQSSTEHLKAVVTLPDRGACAFYFVGSRVSCLVYGCRKVSIIFDIIYGNLTEGSRVRTLVD